MALKLTCPACTATFGLTDDQRGKKAFCPKCGQALVVTGAGMAKRDERTRAAPALPPSAVSRKNLLLLGAVALLLLSGSIIVALLLSRGGGDGPQQVAKQDPDQSGAYRKLQKLSPEPEKKTPEPQAHKDVPSTQLTKEPPKEKEPPVKEPEKKEEAKQKEPVVIPPVKVNPEKPPPLAAKSPVTLSGHGQIVQSVAFSPDGKTLASASWDKTIKLWDVAAAKNTATLKGHPSGAFSVAFSTDGKTLASGSGAGEDDKPGLFGTIKLWDVASRKSTATLKGHTKMVWSVGLSPDGKTLASGCIDLPPRGSGDTQTVNLWDVASGQNTATLKGHTNWVYSVAFSPDGKTLASGCWDGTVKLWDVASANNTATFAAESAVYAVAFSPDGKTLASAARDLKLWDVASGRNTAAFQGSGWFAAVAFSPDGKTLASGSIIAGDGSGDSKIRLRDVASGKNTATLEGHVLGVNSVAFSPDGKLLASGGKDATIKLWDMTADK